jgi:hypothetical protein
MAFRANKRQGLLNGRGFPTFSFFPIRLFGHGISLLGVRPKPSRSAFGDGWARQGQWGLESRGWVWFAFFKSVMIINDLVSLFQDAQRAIASMRQGRETM